MQSKRFQSLAQRIALAAVSIAAAVITMSAMVVLPAELERGDFEHGAWLAASVAYVLKRE